MKKLIFAVAIACIGARFAHAEQNQTWFTGYAEATEAKATNGAWPQTMPAGVTVADGKFTLTDEGPLDFTPTASKAPDTNVMTRVVAVAKFPANNKSLIAPAEGSKTALSVLNSFYYAYANGNWYKLTNDNVTVSADAVNVLAEIDYKYSKPRVRFGVINGMTTNYLACGGAWLELESGTPNPALLTTVSFDGEGEVISVRGDVQLGVASYNSVKYPTVQEAVNEAGTTENAKVTVLRDNNETITIAKGQTIELDTNGKSSGALVNNSDTPVKVDVKVPETTVAQGSGTYTNDASVSGQANLTVTTSDTSKEAFGQLIEGGTKVEIVVRTSAEVMNAVQFDGKAVAPADTAAYRTFLQTYCGDKNGAYMKANTTAGEITTQLGATSGNGLPLWESYVLDLDPTKPTSKPAAVVKPAAEDTANMVLTVPTYKATLPESNYTVKYMLETIGGSSTEISNPAQITIPFDGNQYRVNTVIVPKTQN